MSVNLEKLPEYLQSQRWFAGKAWPIKQVQILEHAPLEGLPGVLALVEVTYEHGAPERYVMPVDSNRKDELVEALSHDELARFFFQLIQKELSVPLGAGHLKGRRVGEPKLLMSAGAKPSVRRLSVEQSNTSIVFAEKCIFKLIRRLEPGIHPEAEIGRFLAEQTHFRATPALLGTLEVEGSLTGTIGLMHEFVPNEGDGWKYTVERLRRGEPDAAFLGEVRALGRTVGVLHAALASPTEDPAFTAEPILQEDLQRWSSSITGELGVTLAAAASRYPKLAEGRQALVDWAHRLALAAPSGQKLRVHGDLHLGQVLRAHDGWRIFDFEGEPSRGYAQRREKHTPLRDVAGMLRSFSYAFATAKSSAANGGLGAVRESFLEGYFQAAEKAPFLPKPELFKVLLEVLEFEKLLYELRYELSNRPDWADIPAGDLLALATPR